ncbi:polyketide synthase [Xylariales sp. AK1849]|nr:polyketide synthase [Xylariales sp. AK1849]
METQTNPAADGHPQLKPIAIVGMSCRLSGDVSTLDGFWEVLSRARCAWSEIPEERFSKNAYHHPNPAKQGTFNTIGGYFLNQDPALFDAPFFNITRAEAEAMDPQQRLLLECAYEAIENAGIPKEQLIGQRVGVFVGGAASDYRLGTLRDLEQTPMFDATGNHQSIMSGRISHYFDLRGPSFTLDTACSSSLYALHQAVQSIRSGESAQAIVAACHLNLQPGDWVSMSLSRLFSDEGITYAFDDRAKSGFARGEGAGAVILKPLDQALKDNDRIRSVIVNTGANQDGRTVGITSPSGAAQETLMREVYARAGISPEDAGFVEAHGTGTKVGDPIEARAIYNVFGGGRSARQPLYIGSAKSNFGHLENASGVISIIKSALMLEKGFILPNTNFETPTKSIPFAKWNMKVPTFQRPWPTKKRYISVNNFGFGGSNAHCILQAPPLSVEVQQPKQESEGQQRLFVLSANDELSIGKTMEQINIYLEQHPEVFQKGLLRNLAYTLGSRRTHLTWRLGVVASNSSELVEALASSDAKPARASQAPKVAFVYTGQGAQWPAMGRELLGTYAVFTDAIRRADDVLRRLGADFSLYEELLREKDTSQVDQAHISQPICSAVQLGLTALLKSWGVTPSSVTGHSSGEIAAAYAADALSFDSAMAIAYHRGQATIMMKNKFPDLKGSMMAVGAGPHEIAPLAEQLTKGLAVVACENSPNSVTVSGDDAAIDELAAKIESRQWFNRKLRVDVAYHSPHMALVAEEYRAAISDTLPVSGSDVAFYSSLHGKKVDLSTLDASYWVENLTCPVRFSTSLKELCLGSSPDVIVEVGPHAALEGPVKQILKAIGEQGIKTAYFSALMRNKDAATTMLKLAANLYMKGQPLAFAPVNLEDPAAEQPQLLSDLIPYPWSRQSYWSESRMSQQHRKKPLPRHDLLGVLADFSNELAPTWRNVLRTDDIPWLRDHRMQSLTTFPFAGFVSMAVEAAAQRAILQGVEFDRFSLREIQVKRPLLMEDGVGYEVVLSMCPYAEGTRSYSDEWDDFRIWSWEQGKGWMEHCRGLIAVRKGNGSNIINSAHLGMASRRFQAAEQTCTEDVIASTFYDELDGKGATYGPTFQRLSSIRASNEHALAVVSVADTAETMPMGYQTPYCIHPALLDQVFQLSFPILGSGRLGMSTLYMPSAIQELGILRNTLSTAGEQIHVVAHGRPDLKTPKATDFSMDALLSPGEGNAVISLVGLRMTPVKSEGALSDEPRELCYKLQWEPAVRSEVEECSASETGASHGSSHSDSGYASSAKTDKASDAMPGEDIKPVTTPDIEGGNAKIDDAIAIISNVSEANPIMSSLVETLTKGTGQAPLLYSLENDVSLDNTYVIIVELDKPVLSSLTAKGFARLQKLMALSAGVLWITYGAYLNSIKPDSNMTAGLTRTIRSETAAIVATLDLDPDSQLRDDAKADLILQAFGRVFNDEEAEDMEYSEKDGALVVPRIVDDHDMNLFVHRELYSSAPYLQDFDQGSRRLKMAVGTTGALDTLYFHDEELNDLGDDEVEIKVHATGMNFKDVVIAMGQLPSPYIGIECAGLVSRIGTSVHGLSVGDRVCAMSEGAYSTFARCPATSAAKIPSSMSFEIAASIPVVYCTAYYGLMELGRLSEGERVLIHAAAGGVGQASVQLAKMLGAEIYATVGNLEKKRFIMDKYGIPEDHIFSSRDTSFGPAIREATGGAGVDVVINSLAGDFLRETWDCIGHFGRFIEIGKRDITSNTRLEMAKFNYNATFSSVDLTVLAKERPKHMGRTFNDVMKLFETETIHPIDPITIFGIDEVETAFRLLQSGKTTGKLVVVPRTGARVKAMHTRSSEALFRNNSTYVVIGGTGGLGRSMTKWMVGRGAGHILLLSRSGRKEGQVAALAEQLEQSHNAKIVVKACDVADVDSVASVLAFCNKEMPSIAGVVHAGMVLRDVLFEKMGFEDYQEVIRSKVAGAWNIHNALLSTPLDFFIAISSAAGIVGNRGQAAYAAANTFLDAFVQYRMRLGLPASSIDLTAVADVGYLADNAARQDEVMKNLGGESIDEAEVLALIMAAVKGSMRQSCNNHCITGLKLGGEGTTAEQLPYFAADAKLTYLRNAVLAMSSAASNTSRVSLRVSLSRAKSPEEAVSLIVAGLAEKLGTILMVSPQDLDPETPITKYGLDSLNAIELRNWITKELGSNLQVLELLTSGSLMNLASTILKKQTAS